METPAQSLPTEMLWKRLMESNEISAYLTENETEFAMPAFSAYITALCRQRGEVPEHVIRRAGIERSFGHQLFSGKRKPSRDTALLLAFGFEADIDLAQTLLRFAQCPPLYPRDPRDSVIIYSLFHRYGAVRAQNLLAERGYRGMGSEHRP